jgi:hypothetical protein
MVALAENARRNEFGARNIDKDNGDDDAVAEMARASASAGQNSSGAEKFGVQALD